MSAAARPPPPAAHTGMPARVRSLFFASVPNGLATLLMLWVLWHLVPAAWRSFVTDALTAPADIKQCVQAGRFCWSFLQDRWRQILFGTFPYAEQWRAGLACIIFLCLIVITFMVLGAPSGRRLRLVGLGFVFGVALALARREGPPLIRWLAVGYIEFLRVVPLISRCSSPPSCCRRGRMWTSWCARGWPSRCSSPPTWRRRCAWWCRRW